MNAQYVVSIWAPNNNFEIPMVSLAAQIQVVSVYFVMNVGPII